MNGIRQQDPKNYSGAEKRGLVYFLCTLAMDMIQLDKAVSSKCTFCLPSVTLVVGNEQLQTANKKMYKLQKKTANCNKKTVKTAKKNGL